MNTFLRLGGFPIVCFVLTMALASTGELINQRYEALYVTLIFWALSAVPLAVSFYRLRRRNRLFYGIVEMIAACVIAYVTMLGIVHRNTNGPEHVVFVGITLVALIYFMVRALDNIGEGIPKGSKWAQRWETVFPKV